MVWGGVIVNSGLFQNAPGGKGMEVESSIRCLSFSCTVAPTVGKHIGTFVSTWTERDNIAR